MIALPALIGKLSRICRDALERAAAYCGEQGNFAVETEHLLIALIDDPASDLSRALDRYDVDPARLSGELRRTLARFDTGSAAQPGVAATLATALESAWGVASIDLDQGVISSACLLRAVLEDERLNDALLAGAPTLDRVPRDALGEDLAEIVAGGSEAGDDTGLMLREPPAGLAGAGALARFTVDLTRAARDGQLDAVVGRDAEIDQVIEILLRRRQNNPILTGDAGVGKTAIVEGLAQRIAAGTVPQALAQVSIVTLDLGLLQAGAGMAGEFEQRLHAIITEISGAPAATILFIDEAHMLIGAGGAAGQGDAANLLKPALARGGLRMIAATTWGEYKRYFEKDAALARRFHPVKVAPPSLDTTIVILRRLSAKLEAFHGVRITEEAIGEAARMSARYIADRQLPDKAINVLDTACARVAIAQSCRPQALDAAETACANLDAEIARLSAGVPGPDIEERLEQLGRDLEDAQNDRHLIEARWREERDTVDRIRALDNGPAGPTTDRAALEAQGLYLQLAEIQQETPLVPIAVDRRAIAEVVSGWTGVPAAAILGNASATARDLKARLAERVVGQDAAFDTIVRRVQTFQAGLGDPDKPTGIFLLCGPSGVGKTETALALADLLFGGQRALITINMSEYQEAHSVSGLKGAPPGYVGYGKGGVLTEAVRRQPYSVVLLDEVEKAHPDVLEIFYQVFDRGMLEDSEGVAIDFTHTLILLTSNIGSDLLQTAPATDPAVLVAALQPELARHFAPAFLARLVVVPYRGLSAFQIEAIVRLKLDRIGARFTAARRGELTYDEAVVRAITDQAASTEGGARSVDAIIAHQLLPELSASLLDRLAAAAPARDAHVSLGPDRLLRIDIER